jgi:hypothetical protein
VYPHPGHLHGAVDLFLAAPPPDAAAVQLDEGRKVILQFGAFPVRPFLRDSLYRKQQGSGS